MLWAITVVSTVSRQNVQRCSRYQSVPLQRKAAIKTNRTNWIWKPFEFKTLMVLNTKIKAKISYENLRPSWKKSSLAVSTREFPSPQLFCFYIIINVTKPDHYGEDRQPLWAAPLHFNFCTNGFSFRGKCADMLNLCHLHSLGRMAFETGNSKGNRGNKVLILRKTNNFVSLSYRPKALMLK